MNASDIQLDKHYAIRLGIWSFTGRVDSIDGDEFLVWVYEFKEWKRLHEDHFRFECLAPEVYAAIRAREEAERTKRHLERAEQMAKAAQNAPARGWPERREAIIHRQGSVFCSGDYGISRE